MSSLFIYIAMIFAAISGLPGCIVPHRLALSQKIASVFMCISALFGFYGIGVAFFGTASSLTITWLLPWRNIANVDALSAFFLVPIFLMGALGSLYGLGYWPQNRHPSNARKLQLFWGLLVAAMVLLVISKDGIVFLFGWEIMALASFFLVTTEDNRAESRNAGWIYLISAHIGTLSLFALFALWHWETGSYLLKPLTDNSMGVASLSLFFLLMMVGFGLKAGIMPFHFWLPAAHATAPSHVSAMLSGVVLKMGVYGLVRWMSLFPHPPFAWGSILLVVGFISGLFGVIFAIAQHDLKRLLAYHSVENIGIIMMGLGIAMLGRSSNQPTLVVLGMAGCLLHVWNHSFFKSLLFLCSGSIIHHTHTRQIDRMGGLAKKMPWTAALFLIGAVAICGLPPLNGFISEFFVYLGFLKIVVGGPNGLSAAVGITVLAMIGALAGACFVKVYSAVFLGNARCDTAKSNHDSPLSMSIPMLILGGICIVIGVAPMLFSTFLMQAIAVWSSATSLQMFDLGSIAPLVNISVLAVCLLAGILLTSFIMIMRKRAGTTGGTWDCGYAAPSASMQYTASSFARSIVSLFRWVLRPREHNPCLTENFPALSKSSSHVDEIVLDRFLLPVSNAFIHFSRWFHRFQQGFAQQYILYIILMLLLLLCYNMPIKEYVHHWFSH